MTAPHPDAFQADTAAERVSAFLDARAKDRMADPEVVYAYGRDGVVYELRVTDLRAVLAENQGARDHLRDLEKRNPGGARAVALRRALEGRA